MKYYLFFLLLSLLFSQSAQAQQDTPTHNLLAEKGKKWTNKRIQPLPPEYYREWHVSYFLKEDTIIDGHQCLKLYCDSDDPLNTYNHLYSGAIYEEERKVYYIPKGQTTPWKMYDFSCKQGDTVVIKNTSLVVRKHLEINYNGVTRDVLYVSPHDLPNTQVVWIEGIGCNIELINYDVAWAPGDNTVLESCMIGDDIIYEKDCFEEILQQTLSSPSPVDTDICHNNSWLDLNGRYIRLPFIRKGIYIQNGRKYVAK